MPAAVVDKKTGEFVIPAQNLEQLRSILGGHEAPPVPLEHVVQQVFSGGMNEVLNIPATRIKQLPRHGTRISRFELCGNYVKQRACNRGANCKFVHADVRGVARHAIHINYAWPDLESVVYERFAPGKTLRVAAPSSKAITDVMKSHMVLKTNALANARRPLSHCAHYYFNRTCNLGSECQFVHAVFIDPESKPMDLAPPPTQLGRPLRARAGSDGDLLTPTGSQQTTPQAKSQQTTPQAKNSADEVDVASDDDDSATATPRTPPPPPPAAHTEVDEYLDEAPLLSISGREDRFPGARNSRSSSILFAMPFPMDGILPSCDVLPAPRFDAPVNARRFSIQSDHQAAAPALRVLPQRTARDEPPTTPPRLLLPAGPTRRPSCDELASCEVAPDPLVAAMLGHPPSAQTTPASRACGAVSPSTAQSPWPLSMGSEVIASPGVFETAAPYPGLGASLVHTPSSAFFAHDTPTNRGAGAPKSSVVRRRSAGASQGSSQSSAFLPPFSDAPPRQ